MPSSVLGATMTRPLGSCVNLVSSTITGTPSYWHSFWYCCNVPLPVWLPSTYTGTVACSLTMMCVNPFQGINFTLFIVLWIVYFLDGDVEKNYSVNDPGASVSYSMFFCGCRVWFARLSRCTGWPALTKTAPLKSLHPGFPVSLIF